MTDSQNISPVDALIIQYPKGVTGKELIKFTFLELLYQGVFKINEEWRKVHNNSSYERKYIYIEKGPGFSSFVGKLYHKPFLLPFKNRDVRFQLHLLLRKIVKEFKNTSRFKRKAVFYQLKKEGYLHDAVGLSFVNLIFLTKKGRDFQLALKDNLREELRRLTDECTPETVEQVKTKLGACILLLLDEERELKEKISNILKKESQTENWAEKGGIDLYDDEWLFLSLSYLLDFMDTTQSVFDSFETGDFSGDFGDVGGFDGDF